MSGNLSNLPVSVAKLRFIRFLSHSTCWALLTDDLLWPGFISRWEHEFSVGWTNGRYAMRLISRTCTEGPPVREREREGLFSTIQQNICRTK